MAPERYFILIYDVPSRELEVHEFEQDYSAAADAYTDFERENRDSHYFAERADDLFEQFLDAEVVPAGGRVLATTRKRKRRRRGH